MKIFNKTNSTVFYTIDAPGIGDCGTIGPNGFVDWPQYDKYPSVQVSCTPKDPPSFLTSAPGTANVALSFGAVAAGIDASTAEALTAAK